MKKTIKLIQKILEDSISLNNEASIIVSGGGSPINLLRALDSSDLEWNKVKIMLLDERLIDVTNINSNEKNLRDNFFKIFSISAHYQSIRNLEINDNIDIAILGFGLDGHFASIFPCHLKDKKFIDLKSKPEILKTDAMGDPHLPRLTMNLSAFNKVKNIFIIINSREKLKVLEDAKYNDALPIHYLLKLKETNIKFISDFE